MLVDARQAGLTIDQRAAACWHLERAARLLVEGDDNDRRAAEHARVGLLYLDGAASAGVEASRLLDADEALWEHELGLAAAAQPPAAGGVARSGRR